MICPKCKKEYQRLLAISRDDNKTQICDKCGTAEALNAIPDSIMSQDKKDLILDLMMELKEQH